MPLNNSIALFLQPIPTNGLPPKLQLSRGERREGPALGRSSTDYRCSSTQSQLSQFSLQEAGFEYRAVHDLPTGERWKQKQRLRHWKPMAHGPWQTVHVESAKNAVSAVQGHWFPGICVIKQVPGICVMKHHWQFVAFFYHWVVSWAAAKKNCSYLLVEGACGAGACALMQEGVLASILFFCGVLARSCHGHHDMLEC